MKNFFVGIGKAVLYLALFLGIQVVATLPILFVEGFKMGVESAQTGVEVNIEDTMSSLMGTLGDSIYWTSLISSVLIIVVLIVAFLIRKKNILAETQIKKFSLKFIFPVVFVALSMQMLLAAIVEILPLPQGLMESFIENVSVVSNKISVLSILAVGVLGPIAEEVIFRGIIFSRLRKGMPVYIAVILQAVLFGVVHTGILWMIQAFIMGVILALIANRFKSILPSILVHIAINVSAVLQNSLITQEWSTTATYFILAISIVIFGTMMFIVMKHGNVENKTEGLQAEV